MKLTRILAVAAFASFPFNAYSAPSSQSTAALDQLMAGVSAAPETAPIPQIPLRAGTEVTGAYNGFFNNADAAFDAAAAARLKGCKVLLIPGFLSDVDPGQFHIPFLAPTAKGYFEDQMDWLKGMGVDYERLRMESESSVQVNAVIISSAVKASDKPIVIIAHSKGGLDALEALREDKDLWTKVRGVITLQSPYFGSPVADYVNSNHYLSEYAVKLLMKMGGNRESMVDLTVADREKYMADNAAAIAEITAAIPVVAVATFKDPVDGKWDTNLKPFRDAMYEKGLHNDGLVPVDSAALPGAAVVRIEGLDHGVTIRSSRTISFDRVKFSKALLLTLFSK